ncbi:MAG TPA: hypothetical protein VF511_00560 [Chthoniobacterales bacterium]
MASVRKAKAHFDLAQLVPEPIDLDMNAAAIKRAMLQFEIQTFPIAQKPRVFPAALAAEAVAKPGVDARKEDIELVKFGAQLAEFCVAIIARIVPATGFIGLGSWGENCKSQDRGSGR